MQYGRVWAQYGYSETSIIRTPLGPLVLSCIYGGVLISEVFFVHMSKMQGMSNGTEEWCPVKGDCISAIEVSFN